MSLRITDTNKRLVSLAFSAVDWARGAIGGDKASGKEGFENFRSGDWLHYTNYRLINRRNPEHSPRAALAEMSEMRESCVRDIMDAAAELDAKVMRLQRMEDQMACVIEAHRDGRGL